MRCRRSILAALAFLPLATAVIAGHVRVHVSADVAWRDLLRSEASTAVELLRQNRGAEVLDRLFPGRWRVTEDVDPTLDQAAVSESDGHLIAKSAIYDADGWDQVGTFFLDDTRRGWARKSPWARTAFVLLILAVLCLLWAGGKLSTVHLLPLALMVSSLHAWLDKRAELNSLEAATTERLALAVRALEETPALDALISRPGGVYTLTGISFMLRGDDEAYRFSSLATAVTRELEHLPAPFEGRHTADRIEFAVADVSEIRLVLLPYEQIHGSGPWLVALVLLGVAMASLPVWLVQFVDRPLVLGRQVTAWSFLAPSFVLLNLFTLAPLGFAAWLSLHRWSLLDAARPFVGLDNYLRLLGNASWWNAVGNTAIFSLHVPVAMAIALGLALLVEKPRRGVAALRTALFLPSITSLVAIAIAWQWMLHDEYGLFNWLVSLFGLGPVRWLTSPRTALLSVMMLSVWMVVGYQIVLFQAGLAAIPRELYDAARIDGAGPWRRFRHVTLPGLRHTLFFVLVTSVIGSFQVFGAVYVMTEGGPLHATDVAVYHIYEEAWEYFRFGDAAAMSWVLFALIFVVSWLHFRLLERRVEEQG
jgi:ABC-type sugar transport system permease subunit